MRLTKEEREVRDLEGWKPGPVEARLDEEIEVLLAKPINAWSLRELGLFAFEVGWPEPVSRDPVELLDSFFEFNELDTLWVDIIARDVETPEREARGQELFDLLTEEGAHGPSTILEKLMERHPAYAGDVDEDDVAGHEAHRLALREAWEVYRALYLELGYGKTADVINIDQKNVARAN